MKLNARSILERLNGAQTRLLRAYVDLLRDRAVPLGLVAPSDSYRLWDRHVLDSLRGLAGFDETDRSAFDVGSGAGLPGIPLAIAVPAVRFALVESKRRRAAFLEMAVDALELGNVSVLALRTEAVGRVADVCVARALGAPTETWRTASPLLSARGRILYWAGRTWNERELERLERLGATAKICLKPEFQWQGPLVIMSRLSPTPSRTNDGARRTPEPVATEASAKHSVQPPGLPTDPRRGPVRGPPYLGERIRLGPRR